MKYFFLKFSWQDYCDETLPGDTFMEILRNSTFRYGHEARALVMEINTFLKRDHRSIDNLVSAYL